MKPAPFALDLKQKDYGKKGIQMDDFMQQARENFESARAAYDAQKAKVKIFDVRDIKYEYREEYLKSLCT